MMFEKFDARPAVKMAMTVAATVATRPTTQVVVVVALLDDVLAPTGRSSGPC